MQTRRQAFGRFLLKITNHARICASRDLELFLAGTDFEFEEQKKFKEAMDLQEQQNSAAFDQPYQQQLTSLFSYLTMAKDTVSGYVMGGGAINSDGHAIETGDEELDRFLAEERYLINLKTCLSDLLGECNKIIDNVEETANSYAGLSEAFALIGSNEP